MSKNGVNGRKNEKIFIFFGVKCIREIRHPSKAFFDTVNGIFMAQTLFANAKMA